LDGVHPGNPDHLVIGWGAAETVFPRVPRARLGYRFGLAAREAQSLIEDGRSGSEAIATTAALAANWHRESQGKMLPAAAISRKRQA
jgi:hypothetical protein